MNGVWRKLPIQGRVGLLRDYRKQGFSYKDAVADFEDYVAKFQAGGEVKVDAPRKDPAQTGTPVKYRNIVEKQQYWDSMPAKYGAGVKGRQNYMDLYTAPINVAEHKDLRYNMDVETMEKYKKDIPADLMEMYEKDVAGRKALESYDEVFKDVYSRKNIHNKLIGIEDENSDIIRKKVVSDLESNRERFYSHPDNLVTVPAISTTWQKELAQREDIANKPLFVASLLDEGGDEFTSTRQKSIGGYSHFGLDTIYDRADALIKKGYLPEDFKKRLIPKREQNEKMENVTSANFTSLQDMITAKVAILNYGRDYVKRIAKARNIELSPEALDYFTLISYNAGEGNASEMLNKLHKEGLLEGNAFMTTDLDSYKQIDRNAKRRLQAAAMLKGEGIVD